MKKIIMILAVGVLLQFQSVQGQTDSVKLGLTAEGLTFPVTMAEPPDNTDRVFIADMPGEIRVLNDEGELLEEPFLDIKDKIIDLRRVYEERGLLGLAFHPEYAENGRFFVYYSAPLREGAPEGYDNTTILSEFKVSNDENKADEESEKIILEIDQPQFSHEGGTIVFGPEDGYLYLSLGDGGSIADTGLGHADDWYDRNEGGNGQDIEENLLGSILRIDVDNGDPYSIPPDNPFADTEGLDEIYAYGFRNPYRISFDMGGTHELFAGDAGQELYEEVSIVVKGGNYGWNVKEGTYCFNAAEPTNPFEECPDTAENGDMLIDPVIEFKNSKSGDGLGVVIVGGHVYRGGGIAELNGSYLFGTWSQGGMRDGEIFMTDRSEDGLWDIEKIDVIKENGEDGLNHYVLGLGQDLKGEMYILTSDSSGPTGNSGRVYKLLPSAVTEISDNDVVIISYELEQNYPNPFNPETKINFSIAKAGAVKIAVYDVLGREIALVINNMLEDGEHSVVFDASALSSGVYLYKIEAGEYIETKKMVLMR